MKKDWKNKATLVEFYLPVLGIEHWSLPPSAGIVTITPATLEYFLTMMLVLTLRVHYNLE